MPELLQLTGCSDGSMACESASPCARRLQQAVQTVESSGVLARHLPCTVGYDELLAAESRDMHGGVEIVLWRQSWNECKACVLEQTMMVPGSSKSHK